jgi:hypothetical protein
MSSALSAQWLTVSAQAPTAGPLDEPAQAQVQPSTTGSASTMRYDTCGAEPPPGPPGSRTALALPAAAAAGDQVALGVHRVDQRHTGDVVVGDAQPRQARRHLRAGQPAAVGACLGDGDVPAQRDQAVVPRQAQRASLAPSALMVDRPCTSGPPPVFARRDAVGGAEHPAEVRAVGKAPTRTPNPPPSTPAPTPEQTRRPPEVPRETHAHRAPGSTGEPARRPVRQWVATDMPPGAAPQSPVLGLGQANSPSRDRSSRSAGRLAGRIGPGQGGGGRDSNPLPSRCERDALPGELQPRGCPRVGRTRHRANQAC